jgi:hypothetical protein
MSESSDKETRSLSALDSSLKSRGVARHPGVYPTTVDCDVGTPNDDLPLSRKAFNLAFIAPQKAVVAEKHRGVIVILFFGPMRHHNITATKAYGSSPNTVSCIWPATNTFPSATSGI